LLFSIICKIDMVCAQHMFALKFPGVKRKFKGFQRLQLFTTAHFCQCLDSRLNHVGQPGLGPEAGDELLDFLCTALIIYTGFFIYLFILGNPGIIFFGIALYFSYFSTMDSKCVGDNFIHEASVMSDEQYFTRPVCQKPFNPSNRGDIKIIGGFVQHQQVRFGNQNLGQIETYLESS